MGYPTLEQYNTAFQAHQKLLAAPELQRGVIEKTALGTPLAISGGFALTYSIKSGPKKYAVRCFHRESKALERRYQAIARRLAQLHSSYFLEFKFESKGIRVDGNAYPIVKMAWAQGTTLGEYLEDNHGQRMALANLPAALLALSKFLETERVAHGDIQTGNVMVSGSGAIQLIDYDGMFVEEIRDIGSSELGHINFQHPERKSKNPFGPTMDRFSLIALSLALKALHEDPSLWKKTNSDLDAIVFRAGDFVDPAASTVFSVLMGMPALGRQAQQFASICRAPIDKTPSLDDFLAGKNIPNSVIQITSKSQEGGPQLGYIGVYDVLSATNYEACLKRAGDNVEVIGRIEEVKVATARNGKPYIFINFGNWRENIFKIAIWSEGLAVISKAPDSSWTGKWISVVGLMEPPYSNRRYRYSHVSINVTANGQIALISEPEAKRRLGMASSGVPASETTNRKVLVTITERATSSAPVHAPTTPSASNKTGLDIIRKTQIAPAATPPYQRPPAAPPVQRSAVPPPYELPRATPPVVQRSAVPPLYQRPPDKGFIAKLFGWLFG
jgi:hypothetical protein